MVVIVNRGFAVWTGDAGMQSNMDVVSARSRGVTK